MARRCGNWLVVLALVVTTGGHWALLQACAWSGMFVRFAREGSLSDAVAKTFDGRHPCSLCRLVREGRASERGQESPAMPTLTKLDLLSPAAVPDLSLPSQAGQSAAFPRGSFAPQCAHSPPVPPPRAA